jgi:PGF-CTERM protein
MTGGVISSEATDFLTIADSVDTLGRYIGDEGAGEKLRELFVARQRWPALAGDQWGVLVADVDRGVGCESRGGPDVVEVVMCEEDTLDSRNGEPSGFDLPSEAPEIGDELALEAGDVGLEGNITEYEWRVDGEAVGTGEDVSHILESSGDVNVTLSVSDDAGGNATFTQSVSVEEVQQEMEEREEQTEEDRMGENETEDETEEQAENETDEQDGEGLPGFTAIAVIIALLAVALRRKS